MILSEKKLIKMFSDSEKSACDAWVYFLDGYSKFILKVIRSFTNDYDEVMDKYLFVCEKLSENNFCLLKKYDYKDKRRAKLSTWLTVVARNLCVDQFRHSNGRRRIPAAIRNMNLIERKIFRYYFYEGLDIPEISKIFEPHKSIEEIDELINSIKTLIGKGNIGTSRKIKTLDFNDDIEVNQTTAYEQIELDEHRNMFDKLIESLSPIEKFILKLRFWDGLTVKEISSITNIPSRKLFYTLEKIINNFHLSMKRKKIL